MRIDRVHVAGVSKRYGPQRALANVDVDLRAGSLCALLGPNGAGKSTLLGILSTLVRPTAGEVVYLSGDRAVPAGAPLRAQIGVLAHESFIYGELTAVENLDFYGNLYSVPRRRDRAAALLDEVGLDDRARNRPARTYSRGMLQRLALARALMHEPPVLLLDEPFTGLDRHGAAALARTLDRARRDGRVVLVVSHDLEALDGVCDHVVVLRRGKVVVDRRAPAGTAFSHAELKDIYHEFDE
ncbi:MAG: ABC transporter ATP-binding protein [Deltaproteobacteria bacterium]|nr:MAG: ABC transporter ATP-binding protein [Deltaproteobacteria bacterium]